MTLPRDWKARVDAALEAAFPSTPLMTMARRINRLAELLPKDHECEAIFGEFDGLVDYVAKLEEQAAALRSIVENMATKHVTFGLVDSDEKFHADWCPLCRLEKAEQIGSPTAIADWIETTVVPMLAVAMGLSPELEQAALSARASDLLHAIRTSDVLLGGNSALDAHDDARRIVETL